MNVGSPHDLSKKERRKKACKMFFDPIAWASFFSDVNNLVEHILHCQNTTQPSLLFKSAVYGGGKQKYRNANRTDWVYEKSAAAYGIFKRFFSFIFSLQSDFSLRAASKNKRGKLCRFSSSFAQIFLFSNRAQICFWRFSDFSFPSLKMKNFERFFCVSSTGW